MEIKIRRWKKSFVVIPTIEVEWYEGGLNVYMYWLQTQITIRNVPRK